MGVMDQSIEADIGSVSFPDGLFERVDRQVAAKRPRGLQRHRGGKLVRM